MNFTCDNMLGRLATWLRLAGYDTLYVSNPEDDLISRSISERRIYLTRNTLRVKRKVFIRKELKYLLVESGFWQEQLQEVFTVFKLTPLKEPLCARCNTHLQSISKESVLGSVPDYVFDGSQMFSRCPDCGRIYWQGTHYSNIQKVLRGL